jgi:hypothetical protein
MKSRERKGSRSRAGKARIEAVKVHSTLPMVEEKTG